MKAVGVFGGTFDPIHFGHLITTLRVKEIRNLDKIIFVPSFRSPHKLDETSSKPEHRINMMKLAIDGVSYFDYSDFEINAEGISYTVNTLHHLKKQYDNLELIIGYDNLIDFKTWKEPDEILKLAKLVVLKRIITDEPKIKDNYYKAAEFVETPDIEISASDIRERVKQGLPINYFVPQKVHDYIIQNNLYKESDN